jgi:hypothetical protein
MAIGLPRRAAGVSAGKEADAPQHSFAQNVLRCAIQGIGRGGQNVDVGAGEGDVDDGP